MSMDEGANEDNVWSKDIEDAFEEALAIYPPCGRRKIIVSDEGKMYGRNELIARYIKMKTGQSRSRKQVSSHIQVLARKKQRELQIKLKHCDESIRKTALENLATMSSAQIVSATMGLGGGGGQDEEEAPSRGGMGGGMVMPKAENPHGGYWDRPEEMYGGGGMYPGGGGYMGGPYGAPPKGLYGAGAYGRHAPPPMLGGGGPEGPGPRLSIAEYAAFIEYRWDQNEPYHRHTFTHLNGIGAFQDPSIEEVDIRQIYDKFPGLKGLYSQGPRDAFFLVKFWADLSYSDEHAREKLFQTAGRFESAEYVEVQTYSQVFSFGKQVAEKMQAAGPPVYMQGSQMYSHALGRSSLCEYMVSFIERLKSLSTVEMMNSVLENFSILQVVRDAATGSILLCIAYVFEISMERGSQHHIYRLIAE
eukprot:comp24045_c0_seq1/m.43123 comp24045_c0_seq1/g.43123  ORF comp24045_c0_seq1/g.43123 comp24045_c0_seq1/m.43123 type:complete len:418 (-) comp24045_c0_seq1:702-1955(-)